jgi:hypothetical protein
MEPTPSAVTAASWVVMRGWIGCAMVLALAGTAYADVVELDTDERVTGDLKEAIRSSSRSRAVWFRTIELACEPSF